MQAGATLPARSQAGTSGYTARVVMSFVVMKFGGTSVANVERIRNVARHVKREVDAGNKVAVVVSAMAGVTNQLVAWVREASPLHDAREYDAIVATGEQVTAGLLAIVLQSMGITARSWQGWQIPIITDNAHGVARIKDIPGDKIRARLEQGEVAVITGFQGIEPERNRISTLGRGGSDTSAVAIAVAVKADLVRHLHRRRRRLHHRSRASCPGRGGCPRSPTRRCWRWPRSAPRCCRRARSSWPWYTGCACACFRASPRPTPCSRPARRPGTRSAPSFAARMRSWSSGSSAASPTPRTRRKSSLIRVEDKPGVAARIFGPLADANINVDMIVQNTSSDGKHTDMTFTVQESDLERALEVLKGAKKDIGYFEVKSSSDVAKVSVIGVGMRSHAGVAAQMFKALAERGINILAITTSEIKISVLIDAAYAELAVRTLHALYELGKD